jgi:hypothetical protein
VILLSQSLFAHQDYDFQFIMAKEINWRLNIARKDSYKGVPRTKIMTGAIVKSFSATVVPQIYNSGQKTMKSIRNSKSCWCAHDGPKPASEWKGMPVYVCGLFQSTLTQTSLEGSVQGHMDQVMVRGPEISWLSLEWIEIWRCLPLWKRDKNLIHQTL